MPPFGPLPTLRPRPAPAPAVPAPAAAPGEPTASLSAPSPTAVFADPDSFFARRVDSLRSTALVAGMQGNGVGQGYALALAGVTQAWWTALQIHPLTRLLYDGEVPQL
jgi:hypothetical protein